jgi:competence protein ComEC
LRIPLTRGYALDILQPKVAVISVGKNNRYRYPVQETLELIGKEGVRVLRTCEQKTMEIVSDGTQWFVQEKRER